MLQHLSIAPRRARRAATRGNTKAIIKLATVSLSLSLPPPPSALFHWAHVTLRPCLMGLSVPRMGTEAGIRHATRAREGEWARGAGRAAQ